MMIRRLVFAIALCAGATCPASSQPFDPRDHKISDKNQPSEILVLGTLHLSTLPESFEIERLSPLLDRLAAWKPQIVTIEGLSAAQCDYMNRHKARYDKTYNRYCWNPAPAQQASGLAVPDAIAETERLLSQPAAIRTANDRRNLATLFLASGDSASALVQWLRLPKEERREGNGLTAALVTRLATLEKSRNENYSIGAALAARLGLERVYSIDDHGGANVSTYEVAYGAAITKAWDNAFTHRRTADAKILTDRINDVDGVINYYRFLNDPDQGSLIYNSDFGAALTEPSQQRFGRQYVSGWEARNMRMVANIRETMIASPGARVLTIVGASHKAYVDAYLGMMHDVRIADAEAILK